MSETRDVDLIPKQIAELTLLRLSGKLNRRKRGLYVTDYGNTARYTGGKTAFDLDSQERIPVEFLARYLRPLSDE